MSTPNPSTESLRHVYPAMLPAEIAVWRAWLRLHEGEYDRFEYNLRVGPGFDPGPATIDYIRKMAIDNSRKRVDAVAWKGSAPLLIEVKWRAGLSAVGQLLGYHTHWKIEHPHEVHPQVLLIATGIAHGVQEVLDKYNVTYEQVRM